MRQPTGTLAPAASFGCRWRDAVLLSQKTGLRHNPPPPLPRIAVGLRHLRVQPQRMQRRGQDEQLRARRHFGPAGIGNVNQPQPGLHRRRFPPRPVHAGVSLISLPIGRKSGPLGADQLLHQVTVPGGRRRGGFEPLPGRRAADLDALLGHGQSHPKVALAGGFGVGVAVFRVHHPPPGKDNVAK